MRRTDPSVRNFSLTIAFFVAGISCAQAQNAICPTMPPDDSSNACASTEFVHNGSPGRIPLPSGDLLVGNPSGAAQAQALNGDCTITSSGAIAGTKTNHAPFGTFATKNYAAPPVIGGTTPNAGSFTTPNATGNFTSNITGSTQRVHADAAGVLSGTGVDSNVGTRIVLNTPTMFRVALTGSDANPCSALAPCRTVLHVLQMLQTAYDLGGQPVTVLTDDDGPYNDSVQINGPFVGAAGPGSLIIQGHSTATIWQPTAGTGYCFSAAYGAQYKLVNIKCDMSLNKVNEAAGDDSFVAAQNGSIIFGSGITFGFNANPFNHVTVGFKGYVEFDNNFTIDSGQVVTTSNFSSGATTITVASATGIVKYMGVVGAGIPSGAYVSNIAGAAVTFACLQGACTTSSAGSGVSTSFNGGGQTFIDLGNAGQVYFNTNGDPAASIHATCSGFPLYYTSFIFSNDLSSANAQAITFNNSCVTQVVGVPFKITNQSNIDTGLLGVPYFPGGLLDATSSSNTTAGAGSITMGCSGCGFAVGQGINGWAVASSTFSSGASTIVLSTVANMAIGNRVTGPGIASGTSITAISGPNITLSFPTTSSQTGASIIVTGMCVANGNVITSVSGTTIGLRDPVKGACSAVGIHAGGSVTGNSLYQ